MSGAVVAAPVLVCMAAVIYILSPSSSGVAPQSQADAIHAEAPARSGRHADGEVSWLARISMVVGGPLDNQSPPLVSAAVAEAAEPESERVAQWEDLAFSETSDLQTRGEALVNLTLADASRGEYALSAMIAADDVGDRLMAISLLRDWRDRTGDPDGRIEALLRQAASDPDPGVAYQAKNALGPAENNYQVDAASYPGDDPYNLQDASAE